MPTARRQLATPVAFVFFCPIFFCQEASYESRHQTGRPRARIERFRDEADCLGWQDIEDGDRWLRVELQQRHVLVFRGRATCRWTARPPRAGRVFGRAAKTLQGAGSRRRKADRAVYPRSIRGRLADANCPERWLGASIQPDGLVLTQGQQLPLDAETCAALAEFAKRRGTG